jgi:D-tyrosyl-tRNA(Tyr) deacylase
MKAVVQRVRSAQVEVDGQEISSVGPGFLILLGVRRGDKEDDARSLAIRCANLRVFEDESGKMNSSLLEVRGSALVVSQFTLCADTAGGRRPSFSQAEEPERARVVYEVFMRELSGLGVPTASGAFGQRMLVTLENEGPVTLILSQGEEDD